MYSIVNLLPRIHQIPRTNCTHPSKANVSNEPNSAFKRDETAVLHYQQPSSVLVLDSAMPSMSDEFRPGTSLMKLFVLLGALQTVPILILVDSESVVNLIDESVYKRLPIHFNFLFDIREMHE